MSSSPFVGRDSELARLRELVERCARHGRRGVGLVEGDPGTGKTRLISELRTVIGPGASVTAWSAAVIGYELERHVPLAAACDLLQGLTAVAHEGERLGALLDRRSAPRSLDRVQVFEAALRAVEAMGPVVIVVDDLQWVDEASVALLHYLVRAVPPDHVLVVVAAARPGPAASALVESAQRLLGDLSGVLRVQLDPLDRADSLRLVRSLRPDLAEAEATQLCDRASGVPFWLERLAQSPAANDEVARWVGLRLERLSEPGAKLLTLLVAAGVPLNSASIGEILGWSEHRRRAAEADLRDQGLAIRSRGDLRLTHDLVRESLLTELAPVGRRAAHAALARWAERRPDDDVAELRQALTHRRAAGLPLGSIAVRILRSPRRRLLGPADMAELATIADDPDENEVDPSVLLREVARVAAELGQPKVALDHLGALLPRLESGPDRSRAALDASRVALELGDRPRSRALLHEARVGAGHDRSLLIELDAHASEIQGNSTAESERPMRRAVAAARRLARESGGVDRLGPGQLHAWHSAVRAELYFALRAEDPARMLALADELRSGARTLEGRIQSDLLAVPALRLLGRYAEAESRGRAARLAAVRDSLPAHMVHAGFLLAGTLHWLGRLSEAEAAIADVVAMTQRAPTVVPSWFSLPWARALAAEIDASRSGWAAARSVLDGLIVDEPDPHFRLQIRLLAGQWGARLADSGARGYVADQLIAGGADAAHAGCARCLSEYALRAAEAYARIELPAEAELLLSSWDAEHGGPPAAQNGFWRRRVEALLRSRDQPAAATPLLEALVRDAGQMGTALEEIWATIDLASAVACLDPARATSLLQAAAERADLIGANSEHQRVLQLLRRLGVRTWRPTRRGAREHADGLTARETEMAAMVAAGASNPEIAQAFFVSRKTVERHVSNILAKTGVRNRAALAGRIAGLSSAATPPVPAVTPRR